MVSPLRWLTNLENIDENTPNENWRLLWFCSLVAVPRSAHAVLLRCDGRVAGGRLLTSAGLVAI